MPGATRPADAAAIQKRLLSLVGFAVAVNHHHDIAVEYNDRWFTKTGSWEPDGTANVAF